MSGAREMLEQLLEGVDLTQAQAEELLELLTDGATAPALIGAVLAALRAKGAVANEVRGFAEAMRRLARKPALPPDLRAIDIVGTGGDPARGPTIPTGTPLLPAACGLPVIKHGNRSVSSRAGSADVLEVLGLPMPLDERTAGECLAACGFTFLFAPHYHAATQAVAAARRALGVRTVFNILGPLTNPAHPPLGLIGAFSLPVAELMAASLAGMRIERAFVIHGAEGWDEPTPVGPFTLFDVRPGQVRREERRPEDYGLARCPSSALAGGDAVHNADALRAVLYAETRGAHRDCLLLGTALALEAAGEVHSPLEGIARAAGAIDSGAAARVLQDLARVGASHGR